MRLELAGWSCHGRLSRQSALCRDPEADSEHNYRNYGRNLHINILFASKCEAVLERGSVFEWTVHHRLPSFVRSCERGHLRLSLASSASAMCEVHHVGCELSGCPRSAPRSAA